MFCRILLYVCRFKQRVILEGFTFCSLLSFESYRNFCHLVIQWKICLAINLRAKVKGGHFGRMFSSQLLTFLLNWKMRDQFTIYHHFPCDFRKNFFGCNAKGCSISKAKRVSEIAGGFCRLLKAWAFSKKSMERPVLSSRTFPCCWKCNEYTLIPNDLGLHFWGFWILFILCTYSYTIISVFIFQKYFLAGEDCAEKDKQKF